MSYCIRVSDGKVLEIETKFPMGVVVKWGRKTRQYRKKEVIEVNDYILIDRIKQVHQVTDILVDGRIQTTGGMTGFSGVRLISKDGKTCV
jgi:hypothetical protein